MKFILITFFTFWFMLSMVAFFEQLFRDHNGDGDTIFDFKTWNRKTVTNRIIAFPFFVLLVPVSIIAIVLVFIYWGIQELIKLEG